MRATDLCIPQAMYFTGNLVKDSLKIPLFPSLNCIIATVAETLARREYEKNVMIFICLIDFLPGEEFNKYCSAKFASNHIFTAVF